VFDDAALFSRRLTMTSDRQALRQRLLSVRRQFAASPEFDAASAALKAHLVQVLAHLSPDCLGVYWPLRAEFNAALPWQDDEQAIAVPLALPFARRQPVEMHFRRWDGTAPSLRDECDIPTASGALVVPDVLLVPCLGFTDAGYRLGYGGGYYDRYLAAHPHVTAVGVGWQVGRLEADEFEPQAHDQPLMVMVTERGVIG
jgi:5-formyltetrahydrofolate cyclo-ligase